MNTFPSAFGLTSLVSERAYSRAPIDAMTALRQIKKPSFVRALFGEIG